MYETIRVETEGPIATLVLSRPERRNALNNTMRREIVEALQAVEKDDSLRALIITGDGDAFCAGADIEELQSRTVLEATWPLIVVQDHIERLSKPVVAAINGFALGGGCEIALACTLRACSSNARIGLPEVRLGVLPGGGGTQRLPRVVGLGWALHMALTAEFMDADTAFRIGLVTKLTEPDALMAACRDMAGRLAAMPPLAVRAITQAMRASHDVASARGLEMERQLMGALLSSDDHLEGIQAFLEKREGKFEGR